MKSSKEGNSLRLIAIILIAATLVFTVGFAAGGWQSGNNFSNESENSGDADDKDQNSDADNDTNTPDDSEVNEQPANKIPDYLSYLTGLEISQEVYTKVPFAYVLDGTTQLHGLSQGEIIVEIPTENGDTRLVAYLTGTNAKEHKVGAIKPTRSYISNIVSYFGGYLIANGYDDMISYPSNEDLSMFIDLSSHSGYCYTEQSNLYTNANLIEALATGNGIQLDSATTDPIFNFNDYFGVNSSFDKIALRATIPYSDSNSTKFEFTKEGNYNLIKNGAFLIDTQTGNYIGYKNVFMLFADATTYEKSEGTETIIDTSGSGTGYYFTEGTMCAIRWYVQENGNLVLIDDSGQNLTVNRGKSYIAFIKSTLIDTVIIE